MPSSSKLFEWSDTYLVYKNACKYKLPPQYIHQKQFCMLYGLYFLHFGMVTTSLGMKEIVLGLNCILDVLLVYEL